MKRVRVNASYRFIPALIDRLDAGLSARVSAGDVVKVVNQHGCPPANTMGQCYIEKNGRFVGMVSTGSLHARNCGVQTDDAGRVVGEHFCTC